jgi:hypothetical protein
VLASRPPINWFCYALLVTRTRSHRVRRISISSTLVDRAAIRFHEPPTRCAPLSDAFGL